MGKTTLYQFEVDHRNIDCGMCYIIQCEDGSFFVIDSAHMNSVMDHIRIHEFLRERTPKGEKIRIAGWFLSHAHQDHIFKFMDFIRCEYFDDYEIGAVYYNFPEPGNYIIQKCLDDSDRETYREFRDLMDAHPELKKVTLHTGDEFKISNLSFRVLATWEDITDPIENFNDSSVVLMMEAEGQKVLFPGDAGKLEADFMVKKYGKALKSDILQLAHHCFRGGSVEFYEMADAPVLLVPTDQKHYDENRERDTTKKAADLSKEMYIAGNGTVCIQLPYKANTAKVLPWAINHLVHG